MKALIIEDEHTIAESLKRAILSLRPETEIIGVATSIKESVKVISANPDLDIIFSDIKIDDGYSFSVFEAVETKAMVVFTTAYNEYALKAFDYNCIDYLLKPVSDESLRRALVKCETFSPRADSELVREASEAFLQHTVKYRKKISLTIGSNISIRNVHDICYIYSEKGNVRVFMSDGSWGGLNTSLLDIIKSLPRESFYRINRQAIVNADFIDGIVRGLGRESFVVLKPPFKDQKLKITQETKKELIESILKQR